MYLPRHFAESDLARLDELVARDAFATLVTTRDGLPFASHLPVLYRRNDDRVRFLGHWARANPQWRELDGGNALLIVHGPHAYISPSWYPDPMHSVPTWNYAVAHAYGRVAIMQGADAVEPIVTELAQKYEANQRAPWRFAGVDPAVRAELDHIVGFELAVDRIELKLKLNQHHPPAKVEGAIRGLRSEEGSGFADVATLMERALATRGSNAIR